jgi:hypothetical protein
MNMNWQSVLRNARLVVPISLVQGGLYFSLNHHPFFPSRLLPTTWIDDMMPFWPWTMWPYLVMMFGTIALPLVVRQPAVFRQALWAYIPAYILTYGWHLFWPTHLIRPVLEEDGTFQTWAYRVMLTLDSPHSCFPSAHIVGPMILCWAFWKDGHHLGPLVLALFPFFSLTILTTKQHYFWDLLGGYAIGLSAIGLSYLGMRLVRKHCRE